MKKAGIIIFLIGLVMTMYTGFTYVTKEKVVDIGDIQITRDNDHTVNWQPYLGVGIMIVGGAVYFLDKKKTLAI